MESSRSDSDMDDQIEHILDDELASALRKLTHNDYQIFTATLNDGFLCNMVAFTNTAVSSGMDSSSPTSSPRKQMDSISP